MTDSMTPELSTNPRSAHRARLSFIKPIAVTLLLVSVGVLGVIEWQREPAFATATGRIIYQGKPLLDAFVMSFPVRGGLSSLSKLDSDGRFNLSTNGIPGAPVGKHRLVVQAYTRDMPPVPRIPGQFTSESKTPLAIEIAEGQPNHFEFDLDAAK